MKKPGKNVTFYKIEDACHGKFGFDNDIIFETIDRFLKDNI